MSNTTKIQWCDSTVNPIMGCGGCELFPDPKKILKLLDKEGMKQSSLWQKGDAGKILLLLFEHAPEASSKMTTTNIYHARHALCEYLAISNEEHGEIDCAPLLRIIESAVSCYAARLHLNKATSIGNPYRKVNTGYAPTFEKITQYTGRMIKTAGLSDLCGRIDNESPWKNGLARMIFVSDMGDAFSRKSDFGFLQKEAMPAIQSAAGQRHLWLWLTKRPKTMARFAQKIGGFPDNVCAMTTLTCADKANLRRLDQLREVDAACRGLSIEPLRERLPSAKLDLSGIDWVIVGGESGAIRNVHPFHLEWALELKEHCHANGVAFFMKQLGRAPHWQGQAIKLENAHGGDWTEWPIEAGLNVREFPRYFHNSSMKLPAASSGVSKISKI